jgi:predicted  nucleic acid-binding Zn-ribbon protein
VKHFTFLLFFISFIAHAQAPVEERQIKQPVHTQTQQKADFARTEKDKAADRLRQAEQDVKDAQGVQTAAEKQLETAKQRHAAAQKALDKAQADLKQAEARAKQAEAEAEQAWRK